MISKKLIHKYTALGTTTMYIALDTETTGLSDKCNVLTAYFEVLDDQLNSINSISLSIKHDSYHVEPGAMTVNKIQLDNHHKTAKHTVQQAKDILHTFLIKNAEKCRVYSLIPVGHNVSFDLKLLRSNGILSSNKVSHRFLDTMVLAQFFKLTNHLAHTQKLSLTDLVNTFEITVNGHPHEAEYDTKCCIELLKKMHGIVTLVAKE